MEIVEVPSAEIAARWGAYAVQYLRCFQAALAAPLTHFTAPKLTRLGWQAVQAAIIAGRHANLVLNTQEAQHGTRSQ